MQSRFKDWGDIRVFLAVIREGSTLAASRKLDINQTTVSRRIDVLEHVLGVQLFQKTSRGTEPTETALHLLTLAEQMEKIATQFEKAANTIRQRPKPPIRLTALDEAMVGNIGDIVSEFTDQNPDISFEFLATERRLDLVKGEADVALRATPAISDDRLIARKVGTDRWTYYASRAYADEHGTPNTFSKDMAPHRVVLLSHISSNRPNVLRCNSARDLVLAIKAGQGIGPMSTRDGDGDPDLVRCFDPPENAEMSVWLVTSPQAYEREEVRRFTSYAAPKIAENLKCLLQK